MEHLSTERLVEALHGIIAQLEDIHHEIARTRRCLETVAEYMASLSAHLSSIACQMPAEPVERKEPYAQAPANHSA